MTTEYLIMGSGKKKKNERKEKKRKERKAKEKKAKEPCGICRYILKYI